MNASAFRDLNFKNTTSDHKSRNARASSYDFLFFIYHIFNKITPSPTLLRYSCSYSVYRFTYLSVVHVCQTFNQVCVAFCFRSNHVVQPFSAEKSNFLVKLLTL